MTNRYKLAIFEDILWTLSIAIQTIAATIHNESSAGILQEMDQVSPPEEQIRIVALVELVILRVAISLALGHKPLEGDDSNKQSTR